MGFYRHTLPGGHHAVLPFFLFFIGVPHFLIELDVSGIASHLLLEETLNDDLAFDIGDLAICGYNGLMGKYPQSC